MAVQPAPLLHRDARGRFLAPAEDALERDELFTLWSVARAEANLAYDGWLDHPGREAYCAYRAAEDRADAAQDALAALTF
jgi:hypothetical protein